MDRVVDGAPLSDFPGLWDDKEVVLAVRDARIKPLKVRTTASVESVFETAKACTRIGILLEQAKIMLKGTKNDPTNIHSNSTC